MDAPRPRADEMEQLDLIIRTRNRYLVELAQEVFYGKNVFAIVNEATFDENTDFEDDNDEIIYASVWYPNPARMAMIRHLRVEMRGSLALWHESYVIDRFQGWRFLLRPNASYPDEYEYDEEDTEWQTNFIKLQTLHLDITFYQNLDAPRISPHNTQAPLFKDMRKCLDDVDIALKAKHVDVVLKFRYDGRAPSSPEKDSVVEKLRAMIKKEN